MRDILNFALRNPALLVVPAIGFVLSLILFRIKSRYLRHGVLFRQPPVSQHDYQSSLNGAKIDLPVDSQIDLEVALLKFQEFASADERQDYAYWRQVGQLLQRAADMQIEIEALNTELERCRALIRAKG